MSISGSAILFQEQYSIDTAKPWPVFEHAFAEAFMATDKNGTDKLVAIVPKSRYPVRRDFIETMRLIDMPQHMSLVEHGVAKWLDGQERCILLFKAPSGKALLPPQSPPLATPLRDDYVVNRIIRPVLHLLKQYQDRSFFHGCIRPDRLYGDLGQPTDIVVGEAISSMPSLHQPNLFETIDRSMADPWGRGVGTVLDDVYALGVTVGILLRGQNVWENLSPRQIQEEKINRSTFSMIAEGAKLSPVMVEFLRATLNDDPKLRWHPDQILQWLDGARQTPKQSMTGKKAGRKLDFNQKQYDRTSLLARDLFDSPTTAVKLIESHELIKWLKRGLAETEVTNRVEAVMAKFENNRSAGYEDKLLCQISMALDPTAPMRYKNIRAFPEALGDTMQYYLLNGQNLQPIADILRDKTSWLWYNHKDNQAGNVSEVLKQFDVLSKTVIRKGFDQGIERCLYTLQPHACCMSDALRGYYVSNCKQLILSLDNIGRHKDRPAQVIDRHIASFISVRDDRDHGGMMSLLDNPDNVRRSLSIITLLQYLQRRFDLSALTGLSAWVTKDIDNVTNRFYQIKLRKKIKDDVAGAIKQGDFQKIFATIDNPAIVQKDQQQFETACSYYQRLQYEKQRLQQQLNHDTRFGYGIGRVAAAIGCLALSGFLMAIMLLSKVTEYSSYLPGL